MTIRNASSDWRVLAELRSFSDFEDFGLRTGASFYTEPCVHPPQRPRRNRVTEWVDPRLK